MSGRLSREDWLKLGERQLKAHGPDGLTLERLCAEAGRTRGSFYHHFEGVEAFTAALLERWRERHTEAVAAAALSAAEPQDARRRLATLSGALDHRLDLAVRSLADRDRRWSAAIAEADARREAVLVEMLGREFALTETQALGAARLFHAVHLAGQVRAPEDVEGFARPAYDLLLTLLAKGAPRPGS